MFRGSTAVNETSLAFWRMNTMCSRLVRFLEAPFIVTTMHLDKYKHTHTNIGRLDHETFVPYKTAQGCLNCCKCKCTSATVNCERERWKMDEEHSVAAHVCVGDGQWRFL